MKKENKRERERERIKPSLLFTTLIYIVIVLWVFKYFRHLFLYLRIGKYFVNYLSDSSVKHSSSLF